MKDITNIRFNKLLAVTFHHRNKIEKRGTYWNFLCDCGKEVVLRIDSVKTGNTKSCGCIRIATTTWRGIKNEDHPAWKGEKAGYQAIHIWVRKMLGKARECGVCNNSSAKRYEWANISEKYKRDLKDYVSLCQSCHVKYHWGLRKNKMIFDLSNL